MFEKLAEHRNADSIDISRFREFMEENGLDWQRRDLKEGLIKYVDSDDKV